MADTADEHRNNIIMVKVIQDERGAGARVFIWKLGWRSHRLRWHKMRQCRRHREKSIFHQYVRMKIRLNKLINQ